MLANKYFKNKYTIFSLILAIFLLANSSYFAFGQTGDYSFDNVDSTEVDQLNNSIQLKKDLIKQKQSQQEALKRAIQQKQSEKIDLNNQLAILDNRLEKAKLDIEGTEMELDKLDLEIKKTNIEIDDKNKLIDQNKINISNTLNLIHKQDGVSTLEILLLNQSLSDYLNQVKYLENLGVEIKESLDNLNGLKAQLQKENNDLVAKKEEMNKLRQSLVDKKNLLTSEQEGKSFLLDQTQSSEEEYQRLLAQAKKEQQNASADIFNLEKSVREKIAKLSKEKLVFNENGFIWPVTKNTVTSYFHDPDYPFRNVFEHPAIDVRSSQGTTLRAAASGYVARAKNAGMGYSYIMLVHGNGLSTVYGHVSRISVNEDDYVTQGQVIGASGGMPGTPGAGNLTTGPHLHFEVRLNGIPVNPLEYLP